MQCCLAGSLRLSYDCYAVPTMPDGKAYLWEATQGSFLSYEAIHLVLEDRFLRNYIFTILILPL